MRQQIYEVIKHRILSQEYDLGDPINIVALSKELSTSNTPIREAISMLCAEGLVVSNVNSKFRVVEFTEEMMSELNETIYILLSGAFLSCYRSQKCSELYSLLAKAYEYQINSYIKEDQIKYIQSAIAFDRCFVEISNNSRLISVFDGLSDLLFLSIRYAYQHTHMGMSSNLNEHKALLDAVKAQEAEKVQTLLLNHFDKHYI